MVICANERAMGSGKNGGGIELVIEAVRACPGRRVVLFEASWEAVDRARAAIDAAGLSEWVRVHLASSAVDGPSDRGHAA